MGECASMCTAHLNSKVRHYGGFQLAGEFRRSPKLPIGTVDNPRFKDCIYRNGDPSLQTQNVLVKLREAQKLPYKAIRKEDSLYL